MTPHGLEEKLNRSAWGGGLAVASSIGGSLKSLIGQRDGGLKGAWRLNFKEFSLILGKAAGSAPPLLQHTPVRQQSYSLLPCRVMVFAESQGVGGSMVCMLGALAQRLSCF